MDFIHGSGAVRRLKAIGLPTYIINDFIGDVRKWESNSGPAWTVGRLKSLKNDLIRDAAGLPPLTWVKKNVKGGWYGVWGSLLKYSRKSTACFTRAVNALMIYSWFQPMKPDKGHLKKLYDSVHAQPVSLPEELLELVSSHARNLLGPQDLGEPCSLLKFQGSPSVRAPVFGSSSVPQDDFLEQELYWFNDILNKKFVNRHYELYAPVLEGLHPYLVNGPLQGLSAGAFSEDFRPFETVDSKIGVPVFQPREVGKLVPLTKDGGWKVRWIASPYRIHQLVMKPLGDSLLKILKTLPWDCTHDQEKPHKPIQNHLSKGKTAFAVDLTSATDYFPLSIQTKILAELFPIEHVNLFEELSRSFWRSDYGYLRWTKGQPMGLYPSFASFALSHGLLLSALLGEPYKEQFFVLGDDVVILDEPLYHKYLNALKLMDCPHDPVKSLVSNTLTEFAGKLIDNSHVIPQYKWRNLSDDNFMDIMGLFGQKFSPLLSRPQKRIYDSFARFYPPLGLNHSSGDSIPLEQVISMTEIELAKLPLRTPRKAQASFLSWLVQTLKPERPASLFHRLDFDWAMKQSISLDERVDSVFSRSLLKHPIYHRSLLTDTLEESLLSELPPIGPQNVAGRKTVLQQYQKLKKMLGI